MLNLIDEKGKKYGAIAEVKETNGVNGERSLAGTIYTNDEVIDGIDRGWQILWKGEKYYIIFSMPVDLGETVEVQFDAVHQFFYDFSKSAVEEQLSDGSHTMQAYLDFIFKNSGYNFRLDTQVNAFKKQSFGYKNRLALFNDVIKSAGVEFTVNGNVVRIINRVGNDLSTIVKKGFNLNELKIEKNIGDFITHMAGFGKWYDEENHDKGRLTASYTSPLAEIYGKRDGDPVVDERYTSKENLIARLKEEVENSYNISVTIDMEDLTRAGYEYKQPRAGDAIMAINEDLNFSRKIRIISYTSYYDTNDELVKHEVSCNSISMAQASTSNQSGLQTQLDQIKEQLNLTNQTANHAMVSADGKNNIFYGDEKPDPDQVKLTIGDLWFDTSGEDTVMNIWNGVEWRRASFDKTAFERQFAEIEKKTQEMTTSIAEADARANDALEKVGVNTDLISEHNNIIASLNGQLAEDLVTDHAVINPKQWLTNYGKLVANNDYDTTDYLPVGEGDLLSLESTVSHYYKLAFYDTDKNNLGYYDGSKVVLTPSGTAYFGNTGTFNAPADGFVRLSYSTATGGADTVKLSNQSNLYTLINSGYNNALSALANANRAMQEFGENLISYDGLNRGYWLNAQGKLIENARYKTTDYIRVDAGETYQLKGGYAVYQVYFYDAGHQAVAYYDGKNIKDDIGTGLKHFAATPNLELVIPTNASYVRIASSIADFEQVSFSKLSTIIANMFNAVDSMKQSVENDLSAVRDKANEAFDKANVNGGKLTTVEQSVDDLKGEISQKVTSAEVTDTLNTFNETVKKQTASQITESLTSYAKTSDLTTIAQNIRTETAESLKSVYTKTETNGLLGGMSQKINSVQETADGNESLIAKIQETPATYLADYQKLINRADLFDRTLGTTDSEVGDSVSRMVQTSGIIQTEVAEMDLATNTELTSKISQLADNINLKVSSDDLLSQINVQAGGVLITSGTNKLNITPETTYIQDATIKSAMIESIKADKITTGTLDAGKVRVINLDANNITANKTSFVQSV